MYFLSRASMKSACRCGFPALSMRAGKKTPTMATGAPVVRLPAHCQSPLPCEHDSVRNAAVSCLGSRGLFVDPLGRCPNFPWPPVSRPPKPERPHRLQRLPWIRRRQARVSLCELPQRNQRSHRGTPGAPCFVQPQTRLQPGMHLLPLRSQRGRLHSYSVGYENV